MHWIAPAGKNTATDTLEKRLSGAAGQFRANPGLGSQEDQVVEQPAIRLETAGS
jgi:hypothetical protein